MNIHEALIGHIEAAKAAGFTVHAPKSVLGRVGHVYITREDLPGVALFQIPTFPNFEPVELDVPIVPSREFGSNVHQDHDGTPEDAVRVLPGILAQETILPRFVDNPRPVRVDRRIPADAEII